MTMTYPDPTRTDAIHAAMRGALAAVGASARFHAVDLDTGADVGIEPDEPVALASVFKIPVLLELTRQAANGERSLTDRILIPAEGRSSGATGLSVMQDPAELSLRDLSTLMMSVSDNAATDVCMELAGLDRINATLQELGLVGTSIVADCRALLDGLAQELGFDDTEQLGAVDLPNASQERVEQLTGQVRAAQGHQRGRDERQHCQGHDPSARADLDRPGRSR